MWMRLQVHRQKTKSENTKYYTNKVYRTALFSDTVVALQLVALSPNNLITSSFLPPPQSCFWLCFIVIVLYPFRDCFGAVGSAVAVVVAALLLLHVLFVGQ